MDYLDISLIIHIITVVVMTIVIMMENRNPTKTIAWILVLLFIPLLGIILYLFFGQNYRRSRIVSRRRFKKAEQQTVHHTQLNESLRLKHGLVPALLNRSCMSIYYSYNDVEILEGGKATFSSIFQAIEAAKHYVHLEYYIIDDDKIGGQLKTLLMRKAQEGVQIRLIYDDVGCWKLSKRYLGAMKKVGIQCFPFCEVRFPFFTSKVNYRNHRKIVIVDGHTAFTGGINVADRYIDGPQTGGIWRDLHVCLRGEAVKSLQAVFLADWYFVSREELEPKVFFPSSAYVKGKVAVQIASSGPDFRWESIMQAYLLMISNAKHFVYLTTPYLMPTEPLLVTLKSSALSGVDVRIIIPEVSDAYVSQACSHSYVRELLDAGVRVYFYQKGFIHSKLIFTEQLASVGTANFDFRSFEENFEVNTFIYNDSIINHLRKIFETDLQDSREIHIVEWKKRPIWRKFKESFARLFSPLL